jgi:hypothetical protein
MSGHDEDDVGGLLRTGQIWKSKRRCRLDQATRSSRPCRVTRTHPISEHHRSLSPPASPCLREFGMLKAWCALCQILVNWCRFASSPSCFSVRRTPLPDCRRTADKTFSSHPLFHIVTMFRISVCEETFRMPLPDCDVGRQYHWKHPQC